MEEIYTLIFHKNWCRGRIYLHIYVIQDNGEAFLDVANTKQLIIISPGNLDNINISKRSNITAKPTRTSEEY
jgi:hypothetical protein